MYAKSKPFLLLLIALMLVIQVMPVSAQGEMPPDVELTVSDAPSNEDANWPIIKKETRKRKDPSTGKEIIETTVVRRMPPNRENKDCANKLRRGQSEFDSVLPLAAGCTLYRSSITTSSTSSVGAGTVKAYAKNYADQYCNGANECGFVKMKRLEVYWTRTATSLSVINAIAYWGCLGGGCWLCQDQPSLSAYKWSSGYFNPAWTSTLRTKTYAWTSTNMPIIMASSENLGVPSGGNDATATAPRSATPLSVYATFIFP